MSDDDKDDSRISGYIVVALVTAGLVYFGTKQESRVQPQPISVTTSSPQIPSTETVLPTPQPSSTFVPVAKPKHFYESLEGSTYYYGAAVTEEELKTGKSAPDMLAFWYLGRDPQGRDTVQRIINGKAASVITCSRPCKIIHYPDGSTIGYDEGSVIGGVFSDASRGFLKKHARPAPLPSAKPEDYYYVDENGNLVDPGKGGQ